jgi:hypothetical protein
MLLIRQLVSRTVALALSGLRRPSMSQAGAVLRVNRLAIKMPTPIAATAAAAFSEYTARPAMLAEPSATPSQGTAQQATHAIPVIQAIRAVTEILGLSAFNTLRFLLSGRTWTVKHGVRSMVKPRVAVAWLLPAYGSDVVGAVLAARR